MDQALIRFRQSAERENRRRPVRRRYSPELQQQAMEYWQRRRDEDGLRTIAASLGVRPPRSSGGHAGPRRGRGFGP